VAPGAIATDFSGGRLRNSPEMQEHIKSITALNRIGHAEDIGGIVAFLCTPEAKWINAQRIEASGGMFI
ncbi:MAG: SDR family oxidoreductase, partial [Bacteroidetes bacterium]|nr:SDR family oxidoreductase [Bacteroidota bacterium]